MLDFLTERPTRDAPESAIVDDFAASAFSGVDGALIAFRRVTVEGRDIYGAEVNETMKVCEMHLPLPEAESLCTVCGTQGRLRCQSRRATLRRRRDRRSARLRRATLANEAVTVAQALLFAGTE